MAHQEQKEFCQSVKARFPDYFRDVFVVDIGSFDINGNNQYLFDDSLYLGVDVAPGRNVDIVSAGGDLGFPDATFDVVISTECFEHDRYYDKTVQNICRMLKPGGLFVMTCATEGRAEHGTRRTRPEDAPLLSQHGDWQDYYRNLSEADIRAVVDIDEIFSSYAFSVNRESCDLYFWGIKKGALSVRSDYSFRIARPSLHEVLAQARETGRLSADISRMEAEKEILEGRLVQAEQSERRSADKADEHARRVAQLEAEIADLSARHRNLEEKTRSSRWLFRQVWAMIVHTPRDISRRLRRSLRKRSGVNKNSNVDQKLRLFEKKYKRYRRLLFFSPILPTKRKRKLERSARKYLRSQKILQSEQAHDRVLAQQNLGVGAQISRKINVCLGVVTYNNTSSDLDRLVRSVEIAVSRVPAEVSLELLLLDNGAVSQVKDSDRIRIRYLPSIGNVGFPTGQNFLMEEAFSGDTEFYVATNPDGFFHPDCLKCLLEMSASDGDMALIEALQFPAEHPKKYNVNTFEAEWASGACLLITKKVYDAIGGFEPNFFLYCDDVDISWRARLAGMQVKTNPRALFFHDTTRGRPDPIVYQEMLKSGYKLAVKWGASDFAESLSRELRAQGIEADKNGISPIKGDTSFCDFSNRFHFSDVRWQ